MLDMVRSLLMGVLEGLTEFVPVSSTGHLIIARDLLHFEAEQDSAFTVVIQAGAMLAVVTLYWHTFRDIVMPHRRNGQVQFSPLLIRLLLTTLPAIIVGPFAYKFIMHSLFSPRPVACALIVGAIWILLQEALVGRKAVRDLEQITLHDALFIGLFQCLGMWPGISRATATIMGAMLCGLSRKAAAQYSFLAAVPVILAASAYDLIQRHASLETVNLAHLAVGLIAAYISALFALRALIRFISHHSYVAFALYRIALGVCVLLLL